MLTSTFTIKAYASIGREKICHGGSVSLEELAKSVIEIHDPDLPGALGRDAGKREQPQREHFLQHDIE